MIAFIQELKYFLLAAIEEVKRILAAEWPNMNLIGSVSGMDNANREYIIIYVLYATKKLDAVYDVSISGTRGPPEKWASRILKIISKNNSGRQES